MEINEAGKQNRNRSFLVEAGIISVSSFVVKIIGVLFKIPLANILTKDMGIFQAAYSLYAMLYMLSTSGLPVAISRMVAASDKRGRDREVQRTFRVSLTVFLVTGVVVTALMIALAKPFFSATDHGDSVLAGYVIAPTLLFVCVCSAFRGYYQGLRNMYPTAVGQLVEAVFKMGLGLGATVWANQRGFSPSVQAACAISGITVGMLIEMILLFVYRGFERKKRKTFSCLYTDSTRSIAKNIVAIAFPAMITSSALYLSNFVDTVLIKSRLLVGGATEAAAEELYTAYTSYSTAIADLLPSTFIYPIAVSILPAVAAALAVKDMQDANRSIRQSIRISAIIGMPCAAFLAAAAPSCLTLLYAGAFGNYSEINALNVSSSALRILAVGIIFIALVSTTNALLQAAGKIWLPLVSVSVGVAFMAVFEYFGISGFFGIYGAPVSSTLGYLISAAMNLLFLKKHTSAELGPVGLFLKPLLCAGITFAMTISFHTVLEYLLPSGGRLVSFVILCVTGVIAVVCYVLSMLVLRAITAEEVRLLPFGKKIASFLIGRNWLHE